MGAPLRQWILWLVLVSAAMAGAVALVRWSAPWPLRALVALLAVLALLDQAFRRLPAFDPLGRIRSRLDAGATRVCALTFDDGPCVETGAVLDILAAEQVPATFFVLGTSVTRHPHLVRRARDEGHAIGIHGVDHRKLTGADEATVDAQVTGLTAQLHAIGVTPDPIYRTPHGHKSAAVFAVARARGLALWAWTRGVWDTDRPRPDVLVRRATRAARGGMVLLLHDGRGEEPSPDITSLVAALPGIIRELKRRNFTFVRLTDLPAR